MKGPLFYSKILLFGEYGIIKDSKGLAIPYNFYNGALKIDENPSEIALKSNQSLKSFASYLNQLTLNEPELVQFDIDALNKDVEAGMYFDSSIPQGYGVGSSGALVAAIYDKYATEKITVLENLNREKLLTLKKIFGRMESFFHGTSSGLDPLNSYLSLPILINSKDHIEPTGIPSQKEEGTGAVFLLDSEMVGETAPMVNIFMDNLKNEGFRNMMKSQFAKYTDAAVENFLKGDFKTLYTNTKELSKIALSHFKPMIPEKFHNVWQQGIDSNDYYLKLCGSGGGGYILGFAPDYNKAKEALKDYKLELVYRFLKMTQTRQLKRTLLKFLSFFSVVRGYNIAVVVLAQYLSAIFIFGSQSRAISVLTDGSLFLLIFSSSLAIASGYIINNFYDTEKDLINRPYKSNLDKKISKATQFRVYFFLNFLSVAIAWLVSWRAAFFYAVYIFLLWFYSHKLKRFPIVGNITASVLVLLPFFGILMHFQNFSWGIFAHGFYLYLILFIRESVKDLENLKGDFANNYQTIPVRFGSNVSKSLIIFLVLLTLLPAFALIAYYKVGYMQYYFYISSGLLLAFLIFLYQASTQTEYKKLHILLKLIILFGVLSIVLIDPNVIINGTNLVIPYL